MKKKLIIFLSVFLFCKLDLNAQCSLHVDTVSYSYFNGLTEQEQTIDNYIIINNSNEEYLTWVSLVPVGNKSNIELIRDFFLKIKNDFNYIQIMYDNIVNVNTDIGYTFIKIISPNETFSYFIAKTNSNSTLYKDRIVIIKKKEVEQYLKMRIDEKYFFPLTNITLTEN